MNLLLSQLDSGIYQVADPVEESLTGVCRLDVADSGLLEKIGASSRETVLRNAVGA